MNLNLIIMIGLSVFFYIMGYKDGMIKKPLDTFRHLSQRIIEKMMEWLKDKKKNKKKDEGWELAKWD